MEMRIDFHTHILPLDLPDLTGEFGQGRWPVLERKCSCGADIMVSGKLFRKVTDQVWDPEKRIQDMDAEGVDMQVLSPVPVTFSYWAPIDQALYLSQFQNDFIAETVNRHPDRFIGLGTVPLQDMKAAIDEMERCKFELGLAGIEIGTNINGANLDSPVLLEFFQMAEKWNVPLFIHPWETMAKDRTERHNLMYTIAMPSETALAAASIAWSGVMEKFPDLKLCFAHGGGSFPYILPRIDQGWDVWPELRKTSMPPSHYAQKFYFDSLNYDPRNIQYLIDRFGYKKVLMGSDYPFLLREKPPGQVIDDTLNLSDEVKANLLGGNALRFLNLDSRGEKHGKTDKSARTST
ncbi:amidohydrolase family protein [Peribacillus frigoritolerans]|uniref:amidohydrolase family protein n=1 Tax=Peribacillus frigoritolerans TaxID=450367 RepID=UPI0023DB8249|nr:amidohydrolase family protein [Peribacillus frigoritolerans]MDF2000351.1 amidohydrolase family protein [Peribacillus frigoritolerans]